LNTILEKNYLEEFNKAVNLFAAKLLSIGFEKRDILATTCILLKEHVYLMYACYRIGVIIAHWITTQGSGGSIFHDKMNPKAYISLAKLNCRLQAVGC